MATERVTFRVYCDVPGYDVSTTWANQIGPDLIIDYDDTKGLGSVLLVAVDDNPVVGTTYAVTATGTSDTTDFDTTSSIVLLTCGP